MNEVEDFTRRLTDDRMDGVWEMVQTNLAGIPVDDLVSRLIHANQRLRALTSLREMAWTPESEWRDALQLLGSGRRSLPLVEREGGLSRLKVYLVALVKSDDPVEDRLEAFARSLPMLTHGSAYELALEFLHLHSPRHYPVMSKWIFSWKTGTGALPYLMEFSNQPGLNGQDRFYAFGANYQELGMRLKALEGVLKDRGLAKFGAFSLDVVLAYLYSDYLYKMYFTTSKSIFSTIPTVLGVMAHLLGIPIPPEAVPTGIPVDNLG
ncbi:MAG: hypothetical protein M0Z53_07200 [Thermaerobacter sp.]|nr:hypothetical protein [Thermaerobacter sp.]